MKQESRPLALLAYSKRRSGVRWADTTRFSNGTPRPSRVWAASRMVSQSLTDPITMPTSMLFLLPLDSELLQERLPLLPEDLHLPVVAAVPEADGLGPG